MTSENDESPSLPFGCVAIIGIIFIVMSLITGMGIGYEHGKLDGEIKGNDECLRIMREINGK